MTLRTPAIRRGLSTFYCPTCGDTVTRDGAMGARNPANICADRCQRKSRSYLMARENLRTNGRVNRITLHGVAFPGNIT